MNEAYTRAMQFLKILYENLLVLHHNLSHDDAWFGNHAQLGEWYGAVGAVSDDLIEVGLSLGISEPSIKDAVLAFAPDVLDAVPRNLDETYRAAAKQFDTAYALLEACKEGCPADVKNKIEEHKYWLRKEGRYKLAHAISGAEGLGKQPEDDDD